MFGRRKQREPTTSGTAPQAAEVSSSGWQAIDDAATALYGDEAPRHVGYQPPAAFSDNLQGCSAYRARDHWHYISYGLSELYVPSPSHDPEISGWGFELTLRVPGEAPDPPQWPFTMVNEMAKHVNSNLVLLQDGDRIDLRLPVTGFPSLPDAPDTGLSVFALCVDPELGEIDTPNGHVVFLQLVGVTAAEKREMIETSTAAVLDRLATGNPLLVTHPTRAPKHPPPGA